MPVSKNGKLYCTKAQIETARKCSALEYARRARYDLVKNSSTTYRLREHSSMVFTADGYWHWNSRDLHGRALEFIMAYEHRSLPVAVFLLLRDISPGAVSPQSAPAPASVEKKPFELPEKSPSFRRLFAYLCNTRKLDVEIVQKLVRQKRIYEGVRNYVAPSTGEVRTAHNAIFVSLDDDGKPRGAFQRSLTTFAQRAYKCDVAGSDKKYAFCCPGNEDVTAVSVFEASIDAISHATLAKKAGADWRSRDRIALGGVAPAPLLFYLQSRPKIREIELCLDSDAPGRAAAKRLMQALSDAGYTSDKGYAITVAIPPSGKDWNEYLVMTCENNCKGGETV